jgi:hypothetical protein
MQPFGVHDLHFERCGRMRPKVETRRSNGSNLREAVELIVMGHTRKCLNSEAWVFDRAATRFTITSLSRPIAKACKSDRLNQSKSVILPTFLDAPLAYLDIRLSGAAAIFTAASTGIPLGLTRHLRRNRVLLERVLLIVSINTAA